MRIFLHGVLAVVLSISGCGGGGGGDRNTTRNFYFFARDVDDSFAPNEVWRTDGTSEGTTKVKETSGPLSAFNSTHVMYQARNGAFFVADDGVHGRELWYTNGTDAGTRMVRDIHPTEDAGITSGEVINNILYFPAHTPESGSELWRSDGSESGTYQIADLAPADCSSFPRAFETLGAVVYFGATSECEGSRGLWRTDGTAEGTVEIFNSGHVVEAEPILDRLFFGVSTERGRELWVTEHSVDTAYPVRVAGEEEPVMSGMNFMVLDNALYFIAAGREEGRELYRTDASGRQAYLVKDIYEGPESAAPRNMTKIGRHIYFQATDLGGSGLWRTDGSEQGTERILHAIDLGADSIVRLGKMQNKLLIVLRRGEHEELWSSGDTFAELTRLRADIDMSSVTSFYEMNGITLFRATDSLHGRERWRTDGTDEGTFMMADICPGPCGSVP